MRILIVEDELRLADTLARLLHREGYTVTQRHDGVSGLDEALSGVYDLLVLDVMLPKMDGLTVLKTLRAQNGRLPVLMLTAKSELDDRVAGLDSGADYYLTKPFEAEELLACVRALLRREGMQNTDGLLHWEDITLEQSTVTLRCGERSVTLSRKEYDLMALLLQNGPQVVTKEQILLKVWGYDTNAEENSVEVYISFLRRKLEHLHSCVRIRTRRSVGYCLEVAQ